MFILDVSINVMKLQYWKVDKVYAIKFNMHNKEKEYVCNQITGLLCLFFKVLSNKNNYKNTLLEIGLVGLG